MSDVGTDFLSPTQILNSAGVFDAASLMRRSLPPVRFVVPGCIPEGVTLLAGAPKIGKSFLALSLGHAIASGGNAFGRIPVGVPRPVLYFALEDGESRLQVRLFDLGFDSPPHLLNFTVDPGERTIYEVTAAWFDEFAGQGPVVLVDTIGRAMPPSQPGDYRADYAFGASLKRLTDRVPGASLLGVHHTRKADAEDFLDGVSGTQGLAGSADAVAVLKRSRLTNTGTLSVTSRDAPEGEYAVRWDAGRWTLDGDDLVDAASMAVERAKVTNLGEKSADIVKYVSRRPDGVRADEIAIAFDMSVGNAATYLGRAEKAGRISRPERGLYLPVGSVGSVGNPS